MNGQRRPSRWLSSRPAFLFAKYREFNTCTTKRVKKSEKPVFNITPDSLLPLVLACPGGIFIEPHEEHRSIRHIENYFQYPLIAEACLTGKIYVFYVSMFLMRFNISRHVMVAASEFDATSSTTTKKSPSLPVNFPP